MTAWKVTMPQNHPKYSDDDETWLIWAETTYAGAATLFRSDNILLWFPAAILGHQALEKYLKAALIVRGHRVTPLRELANELTAKGPSFPSNFLEKLDIFTNYFNELCYPAELVKVKGLGEAESDLLDELVSILKPLAQRKPMVP
jgi:HEPN domain-containing protein